MLLSLLLTLPLVFGNSFSDYSVIEGTEASNFTVDLCEGSSQGCSYVTCTGPDDKKFGMSSCPEKQVPAKYGLTECVVQKISAVGAPDGEAFGFFQNTKDKTYAMIVFNATECDKAHVAAVVGITASGGCGMGFFTTGGKDYAGFIPNPVSEKVWDAECRVPGGPGGGGGHRLPGWAIALIVGGLFALVATGAFFFVRSRRRGGYTAV